jgi:hypothetical protein
MSKAKSSNKSRDLVRTVKDLLFTLANELNNNSWEFDGHEVLSARVDDPDDLVIFLKRGQRAKSHCIILKATVED